MVEPALTHFGERVLPGKYGLRLTRDQYALVNKKPSTYFTRDMFSEASWAAMAWAYEDEEHRVLTDEYCEQQRAAALENFDLNLAFFARISTDRFESEFEALTRRNKSLREITDLRELDRTQGIYVMVLDQYKQAYIGQAADIRKRVRKHWIGVKPFD